MSAEGGFNRDFLDILQALTEHGVEFVVVGAHALALHGIPRATGDLDLLLRPTSDNAERVVAALVDFGAPLQAHGVLAHDFTSPELVYQIGLPPRRIDLLTSLSGVSFAEAFAGRVIVEIGGAQVAFLGREALLKNKRATGRDKDLVDLAALEASKRDPGTRGGS